MDRYAFVVLYKVALKFHRSWVNDFIQIGSHPSFCSTVAVVF